MRLRRCPLALALGVVGAANAVAQRWHDVPAVFPGAPNALPQALRDVQCDALVLLVASHPDDRYLLPAAWLRRAHGARVALLLATRGGGAQNSAGPETGDEFERIRTLEAEVGCARLGVDVWHLGRPDAGYRRSAADTLAEWGEAATVDDLARLLRRIRPDVVMTTHHAAEQHGHDLALIELLPAACRRARDEAFRTAAPPHDVAAYWTGPDQLPGHGILDLIVDAPDAEFGTSLREQVYAILRDAHRSPGAPAPLDEVFPPTMRFVRRTPGSALSLPSPAPAVESFALPSLWDRGVSSPWLEHAARCLRELPRAGPGLLDAAVAAVHALEIVRANHDSGQPAAVDPARLERRLVAARQLVALAAGVRVALAAAPGAVAVPGEALAVSATVRADVPVAWRAGPLDGGRVDGAAEFQTEPAANLRVQATGGDGDDPMAPHFRAERFVPPLRVRVEVRLRDLVVPIDLALPVELRAPITLRPQPRALLLPSGRRTLQFTVEVTRHGEAPVQGEVDVRAAAGYAIAKERQAADLRTAKRVALPFAVTAPASRRPGVDVLRIGMGDRRVELPVHKVDVVVPHGLRVGIVRGNDDTLGNVLGDGGLGIALTALDDAAIAAAAFAGLDAIVVDIRALRERPAARRAFDRLLDFAAGAGKRLVVLYQKDVEFQPPGEDFVGAPFRPFVLGKARVTRPDAPVRVLQRDHLLLTHPNRIGAEDWDGWDQERALYLPSEWSEQCDAVLELHDPGQPPARGALLYARHGDGEYVYCALSLWRQLKKLHPGAVRLLANLLTPSPGR
jgi:LmbE family N-acetylglucosaminyl deacetylase